MDADSFPPRDEGLSLHTRLLAGDPLASRDLCRRYLPPLTACLARRSPLTPFDFLQTAAHDALLAYLQSPKQFDAGRLDLAGYLRMAAHRDLLNLLAKERRQRRPLNPLPEVEDASWAGNHQADGPLEQLMAREQSEVARDRVRRLRADLGPADQRVLDLMLDGERGTANYAGALEVADRSPAEQEQIVKRAKDRVKKRVLRGGRPDDRSGEGHGGAGAA